MRHDFFYHADWLVSSPLRFTRESDEDSTQVELINVNDSFTTHSGDDKYDCDTIFWITLYGSEKVLHAYTQSDGKKPQAGLNNVDDKVYGTTYDGGNHSQGTVFSITTSGTRECFTLCRRKRRRTPVCWPQQRQRQTLRHDESGGGTVCGEGCGTVFSISTDGAETVLHSFDGGTTADGAYPQAGLIYLDGTLYGTTGSGGANGNGTVYTITGF